MSDGPQMPAALRVTHEMWVAMLCDPVMAAFVIFRIRLDAFQAARLRYYWWSQNVIDSSGITSGKTIVDFLFLCLRGILIPDQEVAIYYPSFETGKNTFWTYFQSFTMPSSPLYSPVFVSQLGNPLKVDDGDEIAGDGTTHGPACYKAFFRNRNKLLMPAPSFAKDAVTSAGLRLNALLVEEWTHIDASSAGINKQLIDRTTRPSWNQFHPIWGNHILYSAHAQTLMHPAASRFKAHLRRIVLGDPTYANLHYSYKDYSNLICHTGKSFRDEFRVESTITNKRNACSEAEWLGQGFGIWGANGIGWFTEEALLRAQNNGRLAGLTPVLSRRQFIEMIDALKAAAARN